MEVIVDLRDGDMSKSKKYCSKAIRQQRRKKQLTWKGWWRRKILNQWYHCKNRCNCLKAHFNSPLSACFSQLSQPLLSAVKCHPTAQRGTNITGSKKKESFQDGNLVLLTSHCSHVMVAALLSRAVTQPVLTLGRARTFVSYRNSRQQVLLVDVLQVKLLICLLTQAACCIVLKRGSHQTKKLHHFKEPLSPLKSTLRF